MNSGLPSVFAWISAANPSGELVARELPVDELGDFARGQKVERDLSTDTARLQVELELRERMLAHQKLGRSNRRDDQYAHRPKARR